MNLLRGSRVPVVDPLSTATCGAMSSRIANRENDASKEPASRSASALSHVEIVPREPPPNESDSSANRHVLRAEFPDQQQETVISKQSNGPHSEAASDVRSSKGPEIRPIMPIATTPNEMGVMLVGTELGHFRLEQFVGGGGMGAVFRGTDVRLGRTVAVKVLSRDRTDVDTLRRFQNEAQSAARLDHGNIARVYYVGEDRGLHYIVFEFIEGTNVRDLVQQKGPLPLEEAINYVLQVAEALEHASLRNVIHRDIKPSNVLVTPEGRAKLVDMGLARLHPMDSEVGDLTASGVTLGTFDYISPEQARDPRTADVRSDLYSLGCTFYFMLTGRPPFPQGTMLQKLLSHSADPPLDPRTFRPELDEQVVQVVERLLAKQPGRRFQRPSELIGQLLLVAERLNMQTIARNGAVWIAPRETRFARLSWVVPWAVPLLLFVVFALLMNGTWSTREPFEFERMAVQLEPLPMDSGALEAGLIEEDAGDSHQPLDELPPADQSDPPAEAAEATEGELSESGAVAESPEAAEPDALPEDLVDSVERRPGDPPPERLPTLLARAPLPRPPRMPSEATGSPGTDTEGEAPTEAEAVPDPDDETESTVPPPARILVTDEPDQVSGDDVLAVASFAEACRRAQQLGTQTIELHYNGVREETPVELGSGPLNVSRGAGYEPTIVFRPTYNDPVFGRSMIRANGSQLTWRGVHVLLDLTDAPTQGWSLFRLRSFVHLDIRDAVLTIRNLDSRGEMRHTPVDFFVLEPERTVDTEEGAELESRLTLTDCILRGQASVLRSEPRSAFRFVLQNSLVVARGWLFQIADASSASNGTAGSAEVVVRQVTAVLRDGLGRVAGGGSSTDLLELGVQTSDNLIELSDPEGVLFEWVGVEEPSEMESQWQLEGRDNTYGGVTRFLRLRPADSDSDPLVVDIDSLDQLSFLDEQRPRFQPALDSPASELTEDKHWGAHYQRDSSVDEGVEASEEGDEDGSSGEDSAVPGANVRRLPTQREPTSDPVAEPEND